jgi:hypothetical protein
MRRKKAAALIGAAAVVGSLGVGGVQMATAADQTTKTAWLDSPSDNEVWKVVTKKGGIIKSVETMDKYSPGDRWAVIYFDHQGRAKAGACGNGSTEKWSKSLGTVGVVAKSPWGPGGDSFPFTQLRLVQCEGDGYGAKIRISYVGDISFYKVT